MNAFEGKVVLITGAGRGAGRVLAERFASEGAHLAASDISPINVEEIVAGRPNARAYVEDMTRKVAVQALAKQVEDDLGAIDILINHAGVEPHAAILDMDEWDWHRTLDANLTAAFLTMQSIGRMMRERGRGVIVNVIPAGGNDPGKGWGAYLASVAGLAALTRAAASELSEYAIRVHAVGTGLASHPVPTSWTSRAARPGPPGRDGRHVDGPVPGDVAGAVLYLCSQAAAGLNGQIVNVEEP